MKKRNKIQCYRCTSTMTLFALTAAVAFHLGGRPSLEAKYMTRENPRPVLAKQPQAQQDRAPASQQKP